MVNQPAELTTLTQLVVASALKDAVLVPPLPDCGVVMGRSHQGRWNSAGATNVTSEEACAYTIQFCC